MSKMQRDKGARVEREIVQKFKEIGLWAEKVPLSGAAGGSFAGDILVEDYTVEVKARKDGTGFKLLYRWLGDNDILVCKQDRTEPLVVMTIQTLGNLLDEHGPPPSPRMEKHFDLECYHTPPPPKEQPKPENERQGPLTDEELDELARGLQEINDRLEQRNEMARAVREVNDRTARGMLRKLEEEEGRQEKLNNMFFFPTKSKKERDL